MKCYKCETILTDQNETEEHIILNACGGRLKSKKLLCKNCNSNFGDSCDKALADQTNGLVNLLLIKRHRGKAQSIKGKLTSTGEDYLIQSDGKPIMSKPIISTEEIDGNVQLSITARNEKELRTILNGLKRKYTLLDVDEILKSANSRKEYLDDPIEFQISIGGESVFKSIAKTAINFFMYKGGDRNFIKHLFRYLDGEEELDIVWMHYPNKKIYFPKEEEVSHIIRIVGDNAEKTLYAYIELFNTHNYIVRLNDNYSGNYIDETYAFDLIERKEINRTIPFGYTKANLVEIFAYKNQNPFSEVKRRFERTLSIAMKLQTSNHHKRLINDAMSNSLGKYPEGILITKKMTDELTKELMNEITPMIFHQFKKREKF